MKFTGMDNFAKQLRDAHEALKEIGGELGNVSFDPHDPASIELAIQNMEALIDQKVGNYADNPIIAPVIADMKEQYRSGILQQAAAARLKGDDG